MKPLLEHWELHECKDYPGRAYYYNNLTRQSTWIHPRSDPPHQIYLLHFVVKHFGSVNPVGQQFISVTRSQDEAKQKAEALHQIVVEDPSRFSAIASEHSDLPLDNNGVLGWVALDDLEPEFARIAWALTVNEVSVVFETKIGCHVILRRQ
jgi:hypothetical protein